MVRLYGSCAEVASYYYPAVLCFAFCSFNRVFCVLLVLLAVSTRSPLPRIPPPADICWSSHHPDLGQGIFYHKKSLGFWSRGGGGVKSTNTISNRRLVASRL